jgi:clan AA aspartic protease
MITGSVIAFHDAVIQLTIRSRRGKLHRFDAVVDAGYDGFLLLPPALIRMFALRWWKRGTGVLADGSRITFDVYDGIVLWDKRQRRIPVDEANTAPLIGMAMLKNSEVCVEVRCGGKVRIERLRPMSRGESSVRG